MALSLNTSARFSRRAGLAAVGATAALVLAACGSSDGSLGGSSGSPSASDGAGGETTTVTVGVIPIIDVAPIYLGVEKGFFSEQGLDVQLELAQGGAAIVPGVASSQYQFGFSNTTSLLLATDKGLPIKVVASGNQAAQDANADFGGIVVKDGSDIQSAKDLAGKKVGVNTLNNIMTTTINELVRKDGGDPAGITYVELPFPEMAPAVAKGDIDAGQVVEPFLTIAKGEKLRSIGSNLAGVDPGMQVALYFTSQSYMQGNGETVEKFRTAINTSLDYAQSHEDEVRAVLSTYTQLDEKQQQAVVLPQWSAQIDSDSVKLLSDLGKKDGLFENDADLAQLLP
ncbi:ABC transporter substrate-binding protein [Phycicoccus sp. CSK15P-2]|uniref:ABC transporter substrate-binding protein n=1 Tax=Phycicoccus sp. CSK15P-2 TaxID=2807627 RepID=UPI001951B317|nr:ABC transporter substrate-binding protein [Phycicoccus sp. CSK15P-2]MBM6403179.1 ABC transporter substrate-binding protein [Phycicoccus sp. CSK15P-2]